MVRATSSLPVDRVADHQHRLSVSGDAIYHSHELVHQGARHDELGAIDLAADYRSGDDACAVCGPRLIFLERALQQLLVGNVDGECHHTSRHRVRIAQQSHGQMNVHVLAGLGARAEFALEAALLKNRGNHLPSKKNLFFWPIEPRDILTSKLFGRITIQAYTLVTSGDISLKVGGNDSVVQLVENARLKRDPVLCSARTTASFRADGFLLFFDRWRHG